MTQIRSHFPCWCRRGFVCLPVICLPLAAGADPLHFIHPRSETTNLLADGAAIGKVELGEDLDDVIHDLGAPTTSDAAMGKSVSTWKGRGSSFLEVYAARNFGHDADRARVREIRTNSPVFRTIAGLGVGSPVAALVHRYGLMKAVGSYAFKGGRATVYDVAKRGVAFDLVAVGGTQHCVAVTVHIPGESLAATYLPLEPDFQPSP